MADLSGYTALTETHGATSAADLIDRYLQIVSTCLIGDCKLQERTGDEVMILSASPDFLLSTALMILQQTAVEENFLQVHGGLHYGKLLERNNSYFGSAINLTARMAAKATGGTFWCSDSFTAAVSGMTGFKVNAKGKHRFKNVHDETSITEVSNNGFDRFVIDPVCRMLILDKNVAVQHAEKTGTYFCSHTCHDIFNSREL
jgi:adenylate cyclase